MKVVVDDLNGFYNFKSFYYEGFTWGNLALLRLLHLRSFLGGLQSTRYSLE